MMKRFCIFVFLFASILFPSFSNAQQPVFKNFQVKDGLPSSEVYDVFQDSKGYMWFCTDKGVSRYDGYSFRNYSTENGLPDNTVFGAFEDHKGRIWFRSMTGKISYFLGDSIYRIGANREIVLSMKNSIMCSMYTDTGDTIWCGLTDGTGYFKIAPPYQGKDFSYKEITYNSTYLFEIDTLGFIWGRIVDTKFQHYITNKGQKKVIQFFDHSEKVQFLDSSFLPPKPISPFSFKRIHAGEYVFCAGHGISRFTRKFSIQTLASGRIISCYQDPGNDLWLGFSKEGVSCHHQGNSKNGKTTNYLPGLSVSSVKCDSEGGYWFCTLENGVYYMPSRRFLYYNTSNGLRNNKILTAIAWDSVSILTGDANGNIDLIEKGKVTPFNSDHPKGLTSGIYRLQKGPKNTLLAASIQSYIQDLSAGIHSSQPKITYIYPVPSSLKCFSTNKQGRFWGANPLFLIEMSPETGRPITSITTKSRILSLYSDEQNTIWLGCMTGLWKCKDTVLSFMGDSIPAFRSRIEDIKAGPDGTIWFATRGNGLIVKKGNQITQLSTKNGLSSNSCSTLLIDQAGVVWVGTNSGIDKITSTSEGNYTFSNYSIDDGLLSNEVNQLIQSGDTIWAATNYGLIFFPSKAPAQKKYQPPVYITGLSVNYVKSSVSGEHHFKYFENFLQLNFTGLSYKGKAKLMYKYRLEGLDTSWIYTQNTSLQYTTLPPGDYTFRVYGITGEGEISAHPASLHFTIAKPFWLETWFLITMALSLVSLAILFFKLRIRAVEKRILEKSEVSRKMTEMELKALRAQMNPHFIFNCISSIQCFILENNVGAADKYLSKFSKLIRNVLTNSKSEHISLGTEIQTLNLYVELESMRFSSKFTHTVIIDPLLEIEKISIPPLILQPYVENAIWHGLLHLVDKSGKLTIRLDKEGDLIKCTIEDNGIGREKSMELRKPGRHQSFGLTITNERLDGLKPLPNTKERVKIIDKYDEQGFAQGTKIEVLLPIQAI
jgi:ligand-binding sensor domain-containing protein